MTEMERLYTPPQIGAPGRAAARERRRQLRRTGLFVVLMALVLVALVVLLHYRNLEAIQLDTHLPFTDGLRPGAAVEQAGYTIGTVTAITPLFPDPLELEPSPCLAAAGDDPLPLGAPCFRVRLRIKDKWPIPRDSVAVIESKLLQGAVVVIEPGSRPDLLVDGETIVGRSEKEDLTGGAKQLLAKLTELLDHVRGIMDDAVRPMLVSVREQVAALQGLVVKDQTGDSGAALQDVAELLKNLKRLTGDLASQADEERNTDVGKLVRATRVAAENVESITGAINSRTREIREAVEQFSRLGNQLNKLVKKSGPDVERSLTDTQYIIQETATALTPILNNIDETTRNLLELSRKLRDNPVGALLGGHNTRDNAPDNYR
jgi:phospholipid/cholesterol/gamma-HCH transport system substrate-binding protein